VKFFALRQGFCPVTMSDGMSLAIKDQNKKEITLFMQNELIFFRGFREDLKGE
jgi:hypothetical protein